MRLDWMAITLSLTFMTATFGAAAERCVTLPCDATDNAQLAASVSGIGAMSGGLYGLVYCSALPSAGFARPLQELPLARWDALLRTNVTGAWLAVRAAMLKAQPAMVCDAVHPLYSQIHVSAELRATETAYQSSDSVGRRHVWRLSGCRP